MPFKRLLDHFFVDISFETSKVFFENYKCVNQDSDIHTDYKNKDEINIKY